MKKIFLFGLLCCLSLTIYAQEVKETDAFSLGGCEMIVW